MIHKFVNEFIMQPHNLYSPYGFILSVNLHRQLVTNSKFSTTQRIQEKQSAEAS